MANTGVFKAACLGCHGGCVMGGGQPRDVMAKRRELRSRAGGLFATDEKSTLQNPGENQGVRSGIAALGQEKEHRLLHRNR